MQRRTLFWQMYPYFLIPILLSLFILSWLTAGIVKQLYLDRVKADLEIRCRLLSVRMDTDAADMNRNSLQALVESLSAETGTRFTVILPDGTVTADSESDPAEMDNHLSRPEIAAALRGETGTRTRYSYTLGQNMFYVAVPVIRESSIAGVVRGAVSVSELSVSLRAIYRRIGLVGLLLALGIAVLNLILTWRIQKPLNELHQAAQDIGAGDLSRRVHLSRPREFVTLANTMNEMAETIKDRVNAVTRQKNEFESILTGMQEGILLIDAEERIIQINRAARLLFGAAEITENIPVQEVIRNTDIIQFIRNSLTRSRPMDMEITLHRRPELILQMHATPLYDGPNQTGAVIVLNDITRFRNLENIRREFVANVSHELKTPITAIKGSVETLLDEKKPDAATSARFLEIIRKHARRLHLIIEDLLSLSRLETHGEEAPIDMKTGDVKRVVEEAVTVCRNKALEKKVDLIFVASDPLPRDLNSPLLEEAVVNLIDNAIKYSEAGKTVTVRALRKNDSILIEVADQGCGIAPEHLPRIFERFYRVGRARSRAVGGTGLGLAIVKHIVQVHGGEVSVESRENEGSTFRIVLPEK
ncbi:MAG TPA: HAMP domain-containing protein [bacterium]|nr:HAMP domain-containing protein [bacterium]